MISTVKSKYFRKAKKPLTWDVCQQFFVQETQTSTGKKQADQTTTCYLQ